MLATDPSNIALISSFVLELRGQGTQLPYDDYCIIQSWLKKCHDSDHLLLVLDELLPAFFQNKKYTPSLRKIDPAVTRAIALFNVNDL